MNYQPQLLQDFFHQQYLLRMCFKVFGRYVFGGQVIPSQEVAGRMSRQKDKSVRLEFHDLTRPISPKWWWHRKGIPRKFQGNLGWWNISIWPENVLHWGFLLLSTICKAICNGHITPFITSRGPPCMVINYMSKEKQAGYFAYIGPNIGDDTTPVMWGLFHKPL